MFVMVLLILEHFCIAGQETWGSSVHLYINSSNASLPPEMSPKRDGYGRKVSVQWKIPLEGTLHPQVKPRPTIVTVYLNLAHNADIASQHKEKTNKLQFITWKTHKLVHLQVKVPLHGNYNLSLLVMNVIEYIYIYNI